MSFMKWASSLRFRQLFLLFAALTIFNFLIPDPLPFLDEIILGLSTLVLGSLKKKVDDNNQDKIR